jgi:hypothetical protein
MQVALLFLATDGELPHEAAWRSWLRSAEGLLPVAQISQVCAHVGHSVAVPPYALSSIIVSSSVTWSAGRTCSEGTRLQEQSCAWYTGRHKQWLRMPRTGCVPTAGWGAAAAGAVRQGAGQLTRQPAEPAVAVLRLCAPPPGRAPAAEPARVLRPRGGRHSSGAVAAGGVAAGIPPRVGNVS